MNVLERDKPALDIRQSEPEATSDSDHERWGWFPDVCCEPLTELSLFSRLVFFLTLYAIGCGIWAKFFNFGHIEMFPRDWLQERAYFLTLANAIKHNILPLHMAMPMHDTQRFLGIPETNLAPHIILLKWVSVEKFILINSIVTFSLGYIGCAVFAVQRRLSPLSFIALVSLFNLNGHIVSHLSSGHNWYGFFALPWFFLGCFGIAKGEPKHWLLSVAAMWSMTLLGSFHVFTWCVLLLLLMSLTNAKRRFAYLAPVVLAGALSAGRFLPAAISLKTIQFSGGFPTVCDMLDALVSTRPPEYEAWKIGSTAWPWWEYDTFIGALGLAFILYFSLGNSKLRRATEIVPFLPALFTLAVFALNYMYLPVWSTHTPILSAERITSRFLVVPIAMLTFFAAAGIQRWLDTERPSRSIRLALIVALFELDSELLWHMSRYTIAKVNQCTHSDMTQYLTFTGALVHMQDSLYTTLLTVGWSVTALASLVLIALVIRPVKQKQFAVKP